MHDKEPVVPSEGVKKKALPVMKDRYLRSAMCLGRR